MVNILTLPLRVATCLAFATAAHAGHPERLKLVNALNAMDIRWTAGLNARFSEEDLPTRSMSQLCGVPANFSEVLTDLVQQGAIDLVRVENASLPESFDSAAKWPQCATVITDIRDQSACGCCWAVAAASTATDRLCISTNGAVQIPLSDQHLCFCAAYGGCGGSEPTNAWQYMSELGIVTGGQSQGVGPFADQGLCSAYALPHCHHHGPTGDDPFPATGNATGCPAVVRSPSCPSQCDSTAQAPHKVFASDKYGFKGKIATYYPDADTIAQAVMEGGPVEATFEVFDDFANYVSGIYHHVSGVSHGNHAVKIVGWGVDNGTKYWKVSNSWNKFWGEEGYFRIVRGANECGIEKAIVATAADVIWHGNGVPTSSVVV